MICGTHYRHHFTGHERDPGNLDYMHARYYSPVLGRFLSVDPVVGYTGSQSLNLFSYVNNNPLRLVDPSGLYEWAPVAECGDQCKANRAAFRSALESNLNSKDEAVVATAKAYGAEGQKNGVVVVFGPVNKESAGKVNANMDFTGDGYQFSATVTLDTQKESGATFQALVGHEGQHLVDAQSFARTFSFSETHVYWDLSKNLTTEQTEQNAFRITNTILYNQGKEKRFKTPKGHVWLGATRSPGKTRRSIDEILTNPQYAAEIDMLQLPQFNWQP